VSLRVLARGGDMADEPTQVAIAPRGVLAVSNSQWSRYDPGADAGRAAQRETGIVRLAR
jgi:hypothetical protein